MAIQARRGLKQDFDPNKMLPAEVAVPLDTREVYMAFAPGDVQKIATHENVKELIEESAEEIIEGLTEEVNQATETANDSAQYATTQGDYAKAQGDYAKEQGERTSELANNAEGIIFSKIATETEVGVVRGGGNVKVEVNGDMNVELPDNLVYFSNDEPEPSPPMLRDSDLLGGEPRTYYEQLVQDVADRVTANLNSINALNTVVNLSGSLLSNIHASVSVTTIDARKKGNVVHFYILLVLSSTPNNTIIFKVPPLTANYTTYSLRSATAPYNIVNDVSVWISSIGDARLYSAATNLSGTYYLTGQFTAN